MDVVATEVVATEAFLLSPQRPSFFATSVESELGCSKLTCGKTILDFLRLKFLGSWLGSERWWLREPTMAHSMSASDSCGIHVAQVRRLMYGLIVPSGLHAGSSRRRSRAYVNHLFSFEEYFWHENAPAPR